LSAISTGSSKFSSRREIGPAKATTAITKTTAPISTADRPFAMTIDSEVTTGGAGTRFGRPDCFFKETMNRPHPV